VEPLRFALLGLGAGGVYALIALGVVLVYRGSGVLNFAQGAIGMTGAFMFYDLQSSAGWPLAAAAIAAAMFSAALGIAIHLLVMRRLRDSSGLAALIATLAVWLFLRGIAGELWGFDARLPDRILPSSRVSLLNTSVGADRLTVDGSDRVAAVCTLSESASDIGRGKGARIKRLHRNKCLGAVVRAVQNDAGTRIERID